MVKLYNVLFVVYALEIYSVSVYIHMTYISVKDDDCESSTSLYQRRLMIRGRHADMRYRITFFCDLFFFSVLSLF